MLSSKSGVNNKRLHKGLISTLLDLVYPPVCFNCGQEGEWLCQQCLAQIKPLNDRCLICRRSKTQQQGICRRCRLETGIDRVVVVGRFRGVLREAIHRLKYEDERCLSPILAGAMVRRIKQENIEFNYIVPIPLHYRRERQRGYNQSFLLAWEICSHLRLKLLNILTKVKKTSNQADLDKIGRRSNVTKSFRSRVKFRKSNSRVCIVDDVLTTGATVKEAARVLRRAGAKRIYVLAIAA